MNYKKKIIVELFFQKIICFCVLSFIYPIFWVWLFIIKQYHITQLQEIRDEFKKITCKVARSPLIICPNHLTYIDSMLLLLSFDSLWHYMFRFYTFAWNFPKTEHVKNNLLYKVICYLGKCILLDVNVSTEQSMKKAVYLLMQGEYLMLFPEGHRSTNGLVDTQNFAYGVGKLVNEVPHTKILCVYLRGSSQKKGSNFPNRGDQFYCKLKLISHPMNKSRKICARVIRI